MHKSTLTGWKVEYISFSFGPGSTHDIDIHGQISIEAPHGIHFPKRNGIEISPKVGT